MLWCDVLGRKPEVHRVWSVPDCLGSSVRINSKHGLELSYQIKDTGAKAVFAVEETLELVLQCVKKLGLSKSIVYLVSLEKGPKNGVRTLGDLLEFGEMDWERLTTEEAMHNR